MSFTLFASANKKGGLTHMEQMILLQLAFAAKDDFSVAMSVTRIAERCICQENAIKVNIRSLVAKGVLVPSGSGGGRGNIQAYHIHIDHLPLREEKKPIRRNRKIHDANEPDATTQNLGYMPLYPGEYFNVEFAIAECKRWENMICNGNPRDPKYLYWQEALREERETLAKHGIVMEEATI